MDLVVAPCNDDAIFLRYYSSTLFPFYSFYTMDFFSCNELATATIIDLSLLKQPALRLLRSLSSCALHLHDRSQEYSDLVITFEVLVSINSGSKDVNGMKQVAQQGLTQNACLMGLGL